MTTSCAHCGLPVRVARSNTIEEDVPRYCCFGCSIAAGITGAEGDESQARWILGRLLLGGFLAMNVMLLSMTMYSISVYDVEVTSKFQDLFYSACRWIMLVFSIGVLGLLGVPILRCALVDLRARRVTADLFIVVGVVAAWLYSLHATVLGRRDVYFDTATMLLVILTIGRYLEAHARATSGAVVSDLLEGAPQQVVRLGPSGEEERVALRQVALGDIVLARPGEVLAIDGEVQEGSADIDESSITGESLPVAKSIGEDVYAGAVNLNGKLFIRVTAVGEDRLLARVTQLLEEARADQTPVQRSADAAAAILLPITALVAIAVVGLRWYVGDPMSGVMRALAVLVVACPCALGIATPLALWIGLTEAVRRGVVMRSASALEALGRVDTVVFDKTGTLTEQEPTLSDISSLSTHDASEILRLAATACAASNHPASRAITRAAHERELELESSVEVRELPGEGLVAQLDSLQRTVVVGNARLLSSYGITLPPGSEDIARTWIALGGKLVGGIELNEAQRAGAQSLIDAFKSAGKRVIMLTGDRQSRAEHLAERFSIEAYGDRTPDQKLAYIRELQAAGARVAMIGDGINDAAALAAADVGIAMACGSDLTRDAADVCLVHDRLSQVAWLFDYAQKARKIVRGNLGWAAGYNAIAVSVAAVGLLNPLIAALAMVASSAFVLGNSLRLKERAEVSGNVLHDGPLAGAESRGDRSASHLPSRESVPA